MKTLPTYDYENKLIEKGYTHIAGVDEAGRGTGAGPVVAAAVIISPDNVMTFEGRVNDSKKLSENKRNVVFEEIVDLCAYGVGVIDNDIIDELNILASTKLAMRTALISLNEEFEDPFDYVIVDGNFSLDELPTEQKSIIKGDSLSLSIAAASIVAKVVRDGIMVDLHNELPIYDWDHNKGYLTKKHREALSLYGPSIYHRLSFKLES